MQTALRFAATSRTLYVAADAHAFPDGRLVVVGGGKAAGLMALALEDIVGVAFITAGCVTCKDAGYATRRIEVLTAGHPVPDARGLAGVRRMLAFREQFALSEHDLVLCLLSGGASALMPCPAPGLTLEHKRRVTEQLLASGAPIEEINAVRKHLSGTKGGGLGRHFAPARVVSLVLSDVIGNRLDVIASAPTFPDSTTFDDALNVLDRRDLTREMPAPVLAHLRRGAVGLVPETPRELPNCQNHIIGDNRLALQAMTARADELGYRPVIISDAHQGDATALARERAAEVMAGHYAAYDCVIIGGEATLKLPRKPGKGGRNQHYAAVTLLALAEYDADWVVAAVGTDGTDYLPEVAGGIVDRDGAGRYGEMGIDGWDYVRRCDSYHLLQQLGNALVRTGDTGTNVGDVMLYLL